MTKKKTNDPQMDLIEKTKTRATPTKPKSRFRVQFDFEYKHDPGKIMDQTLVTQPDMTLTVRQLLENHTRGLDSQVKELTPLYFDIEVPTIKDITEVQEYKDHLIQQLAQTNQFIKDELKEAELKRESELPPPILNGDLQPPLETPTTVKDKGGNTSQ